MRQFPDATKASYFLLFSLKGNNKNKTNKERKKIKISILIYGHLRVVNESTQKIDVQMYLSIFCMQCVGF